MSAEKRQKGRRSEFELQGRSRPPVEYHLCAKNTRLALSRRTRLNINYAVLFTLHAGRMQTGVLATYVIIARHGQKGKKTKRGGICLEPKHILFTADESTPGLGTHDKRNATSS